MDIVGGVMIVDPATGELPEARWSPGWMTTPDIA
jgi:hypothetical protein